MKIPLSEITVDPTINIREVLDEPTVERYIEQFDQLPEAIVYDTPEGKLLSEGFHRYEAARRSGRTELDAELRKGTREDALRHAAVANVRHGNPLTRDELCAAVRRVHRLNPKMPVTQIANLVGTNAEFARRTIKAEEVQKHVGGRVLPDSLYEEIAKVPKKHWQALVSRAADANWSRNEVRAAVSTVKSTRVSEEEKQELLHGDGTPLLRDESGKPWVLPETVSRRAKRYREEDATGALTALLHAAAVLEMRWSDTALGRTQPDKIKRLLSDVERLQDTLTTVRTDLERQSRIRLVS